MRLLLFAVAAVSFAAAHQSNAAAPVVDVRVRFMCPDVETMSKRCVGNFLELEVITRALEIANKTLPVRLNLVGGLTYDASMPTESRNWRAETDTARVLRQRGPTARWDTLDIVVVTAFAKQQDDRNIQGKASLGYPLRPIRNSPVRAEVCLERDGVVIRRGALLKPTLAHEIGHWLGLLHTFSGCNNADDISDTDDEDEGDMRVETTGKREKRKPGEPTEPSFMTCELMRAFSFLKIAEFTACQANGGKVRFRPDSMKNLMEYSICRMEFSPDQRRVMLAVFGERKARQQAGEKGCVSSPRQ